MSKIDLEIHELKSPSSEYKEFADKEWKNADIEHFGLGVEFAPKDYKFYAKNKEGIVVGILEMNIQGDLANITTLLVDSDRRRAGIGKQLMLHAEQTAIKHKSNKIWLETNKGWHAEKFYLALGYEVEAVLKKHIFGQDALIFVKFL